MPEPTDVDTLGYAEAMAELDAILAELDTDDVDIDVLAERVARAAALLRHCRGRLHAARIEIDSVLDDLDDEDA